MRFGDFNDRRGKSKFRKKNDGAGFLIFVVALKNTFIAAQTKIWVWAHPETCPTKRLQKNKTLFFPNPICTKKHSFRGFFPLERPPLQTAARQSTSTAPTWADGIRRRLHHAADGRFRAQPKSLPLFLRLCPRGGGARAELRKVTTVNSPRRFYWGV